MVINTKGPYSKYSYSIMHIDMHIEVYLFIDSFVYSCVCCH